MVTFLVDIPQEEVLQHIAHLQHLVLLLPEILARLQYLVEVVIILQKLMALLEVVMFLV